MDVCFSVIVPVYNIEGYIGRCIESILRQDYRDLEIILVDDGSTDASGNLCDDYAKADSRIKVIHKKNGGPVSARQAGLDRASADYIACIDGDDWIADGYFNKFASVIRACAPEVICCGAIRAAETKETPHPLSLRPGYYTRDQIEAELFPFLLEDEAGHYFPGSLWAKVFKKKLLLPNHTQISPKIVIGEDYVCVIPCIYRAKSLFVMEDCLYYYRLNPFSLTKGRKADSWDGLQERGKLLARQIELQRFDFRAQFHRYMVHALFHVAVSQFNRSEHYYAIANDIKQHLAASDYKSAIQNCRYRRFTKGAFARFALKYRCTLLLKAYCKRKNRSDAAE